MLLSGGIRQQPANWQELSIVCGRLWRKNGSPLVNALLTIRPQINVSETRHEIPEKSSKIVWARHFQKGPDLAPARYSFSPKAAHPITFKTGFITDDRYILGLSLSDEHTVKWVLVRARQESSPNAMLCRNG